MRLESLGVMRSYTVARLQARPLSPGLAESIVASRFTALTQPETILPLASHSQACDSLPERLVLDPCVDFGRGDVPVTEGSLHQTEIASLAKEPHGEGMAKRVDGKVPGDASCFKPVMESELDLTRTKSIAAARAEERTSFASIRGIDALPEQSAELRVEEHCFLSSTLCSDCDGSLGDVDITGVQADKRAEPYAGTKQEREHDVVSRGNRGVASGNQGKQSLALIPRQVTWHPPVSRCRADQPRRIVCEITSIGQKTEEHSKRSLGPVDSERGLWLTVPIGQEACERVGSNNADLNIALEPSFELPQIPEVSLAGSLTLAVGSQLSVEPLDGCRELHGFTSLTVDSQAASIDASFQDTVNEITRGISEMRQFQGTVAPHSATWPRHRRRVALSPWRWA
jgi:hypothetical protein